MYIMIMLTMCIVVIMNIMWIEVHIELGLADHIWQNKCNTIAQEVYGFGAQFRPAMHAGWLSYIKDTYAEEENAMGPSVTVGQGTLVMNY
jgi:hypothetical protein